MNGTPPRRGPIEDSLVSTTRDCIAGYLDRDHVLHCRHVPTLFQPHLPCYVAVRSPWSFLASHSVTVASTALLSWSLRLQGLDFSNIRLLARSQGPPSLPSSPPLSPPEPLTRSGGRVRYRRPLLQCMVRVVQAVETELRAYGGSEKAD